MTIWTALGIALAVMGLTTVVIVVFLLIDWVTSTYSWTAVPVGLGFVLAVLTFIIYALGQAKK